MTGGGGVHGRGACRPGACVAGGMRGTHTTPPPSPADTTRFGQRASLTHPTGMHSCICKYYWCFNGAKDISLTNGPWNIVPSLTEIKEGLIKSADRFPPEKVMHTYSQSPYLSPCTKAIGTA